MGNAFKTFAAVAFAGACLLDCAAAADRNQCVVVSCDHPDVEVIEAGDDFFVLAPGKPETFSADVMVTAIDGWQLLQPPASRLPVRMLGGSNVGYRVAKPPESERGGVIHFHNYIIRSNHDEGAKNIAVPAGANVIYTAYRDGSSRTSNWNVEGEDKRGYSSIVFNRNWWNVPSWFAGTMTTPRPRMYSVRGNDVDFITLYDTGEMKVVGIRQIALTGGTKSSERMEPPAQDETWQETEVIYSEPCAVFDLTATLEPNVTQEEFAKVKSSISWTFASGNVEWSADDPLHATCHSPDRPGEYIVTASCGTASRIILVKVGIQKIHKVFFSGDIHILKDGSSDYYAGCAWQDDDLDGTSDMLNANARTDLHYHPIAYRSTRSAMARGVFRPFCAKVTDPSKLISDFDVVAAVRRARFAWDNSWVGLDWSSSGTVAECGDGLYDVGLISARPFESSATVRYNPAAMLVWEIGFGEYGTGDEVVRWFRSTSKHELHLTYSADVASYETVLYLSCLNASGCSSEVDVIAGVWNGFTGRDVKRKDGICLTYYGSYRTENVELPIFLSYHDGQCGAWVNFLKAALDVQGIDSVIHEVAPLGSSDANGFIVKTWSFEGSGSSGDMAFPYKNDKPTDMKYKTTNAYVWGMTNEVRYITGCPGQNNFKPAALFERHFILKVAGKYYDPSYGVMYNGVLDFVGNLSGFWKNSPDQRSFFFKQNTFLYEVDFYPLQRVRDL